MAKFIYKAKKGVKELIEGSIEAQNEDEALAKLSGQGLFTVSIVQAPAGGQGTGFRGQGTGDRAQGTEQKIKISRRKISAQEVLLFSRKLLTLLHAKVDLLSSLKVIRDQTDNAQLGEVIARICVQVKEGRTFSETLEAYPKVFAPLFVNLVKAGEATGKLDYSFEQITEYMSREQAMRTKIRAALAYPVLLLGVGLVSIFVVISFVVPKLKPMFESARGQLPLLTKIIFSLSDFSAKGWLFIVAAAAAAALIIYAKGGAGFLKNLIMRAGMRIPIIRKMSENRELVNFTRALSLLLKSGVVALKAIEISSRVLDNPKLKGQLKKVHDEIASGETMAKSMDKYTDLPKFFTKMIAVGEESGRITEVLEEISASYSQQVEADTMLVSSLMEPLLILVLGVILGVIILSILLPTFQITHMVG
jgi:type II secretory pathway component PulF